MLIIPLSLSTEVILKGISLSGTVFSASITSTFSDFATFLVAEAGCTLISKV